MDGLSHRWIEVRGVRLHVAEGGRRDAHAPVVLAVHGWPQHWWCWRRVVPGLLDHAHVVVPDLRGHGWSAAPRAGYRKDELAADMLALLDALEVERVTFLGHDWGGWIGFLTALEHPDRVDALVALGIVHPFQRATPRTLAQAWRGAYQLMLASPFVGRALLRSGPQPVAAAIRAGTAVTDAIDADARRHYGDVLRDPARARASVQMYRTFLVHELGCVGRLRERRLRVPTQLLIGAHDPFATPALLTGWEEHADAMTVEVLRGVGHFVPEEAPERVVAAVRDVIAS